MSSIESLFSEIISRIPSTLGPHAWYIITATSLIACGKPEQLSSLYVYATGPDSPLTAAEKSQLSRRLRDVLAKAWTLVGIPLVVLAAAALAKVEIRDTDNPDSDGGSTEKWEPPHLTPTTTSLGTAFMRTIYQSDLEPIFATLGSHAPLIAWLDQAIVYGLFLADTSVLSPIESELVTLPAIMCQGLRDPTLWHLRGLRRVGVGERDVECVQLVVESVARWGGRSTVGWPRVGDVKDV